ncbi:type I restriction enzyme S subunit [Pseudomonas sp. URIL14HWK12:I3]|uniref:restriction endonuclease subunit S n=1 Tax=Pseudomonas TaxID=286 RepID=UPI0009B97CDC|nr:MULTISPECIES: restriction endonuclease subunit S [Pseudomonas]PZW47193.1 type I restriction enzyme S subunit [Pseudomonas sp. URIL14HWK12:I2]PZW57733.1 type I restriction enzyme S subunit [Pseudomonas sp. URIL14HWK12:I3]
MSGLISNNEALNSIASQNRSFSGLPGRGAHVRIKYGFRTIGSGTTPPSSQEEFYGGEIPWVNTSELREKTVNATEKTVSTEALREFSALKVYPEGSVLFAMYGATIGRVGILGIGATVNQAVCVLADPSRFYPRFVFYGLQSSRAVLESLATGGGQPNLNAEKLREHRLHCPSTEEQKAIAQYLDRETARIDGLIAEKERMLALLEEKRIALISRVVTRGLDPDVTLKPSRLEWLSEIPAHWGLQRLKQLAEVRGGLTLGKQYSGELQAYPYLRVANVQDGYLKLDDVLTVEVPASEVASNLLVYGDVLMNEGGDIDKLGRGCVWRDEIKPCLHQNHVFAVRPHMVDSDWLALWTSTLEAKRYFESRAKRSTNLASISGSNIKELPVPLPPVGEQRSIKKFLSSRQSCFENICSELQNSLRLLAERRTAMIAAAVNGHIPVEEMNG